jgi:hypothetical protein
MNDRRLSSRVILRTCASLVSDLPADIAAGLAEAAGGLRRVDVLVVGYVDVPAHKACVYASTSTCMHASV